MATNSVGSFGVLRKTMEPWWRMLRALRASTDGMRLEGSEYLPLDWMERQNPGNAPDKPSYAERLRRSFLYEAYDDAVTRIASRQFQRAIKVSEGLPPPIDMVEDNADLSGTSLTVFASKLLEDMVDRGMALFMVDHVQAPVAMQEVRLPDGSIELQEVKDKQGKPVRRQLSLAEEIVEEVRPYFAFAFP